MIKIKKNSAIITGSSKGIGAEIAKKLSRDGYSVVINYLNEKEKAEAVLEEIKKSGGNGFVYQADVTKAEQVEKMVSKTVEVYGDIDVLINNASHNIINKNFKSLEWSDFEIHLNTLLKGAFNTCKFLIPLMEKKGKGKIINITSIYADGVPPTKMYDYVAAKSALSSLTKSLAVEYGAKGITVNNVSPGMTETTMIGNLPEKTILVTEAQTPLRRLGNVEDVANVVSFLVSEAGDYITGETIRVSGGQKMI